MGFAISRGSSGHGDVRKRLSQAKIPRVEQIGQEMSDLHGFRIAADYRLDSTTLSKKSTVTALVYNAREMINDLVAHCKGNDRQRIINAVKDYEESISS